MIKFKKSKEASLNKLYYKTQSPSTLKRLVKDFSKVLLLLIEKEKLFLNKNKFKNILK